MDDCLASGKAFEDVSSSFDGPTTGEQHVCEKIKKIRNSKMGREIMINSTNVALRNTSEIISERLYKEDIAHVCVIKFLISAKSVCGSVKNLMAVLALLCFCVPLSVSLFGWKAVVICKRNARLV